MRITLSENLIPIKHRSYTVSDCVNTKRTPIYKIFDRKATCNRTTKLVFRKATCTLLRGKPTLENFPIRPKKTTFPTNLDATDASNDLVDVDSSPGEVFTDVDLGSTGPHQNNDVDMTEQTCPDRLTDQTDDQQSSGGRDTIVPEVSDDENDDVIVDNKSPRGGRYNLRPNPTPTLLMNTDTSQTFKLRSHCQIINSIFLGLD